MSKGIVYLVGAGPGDPGLITTKGLHCLRIADVVVYDYLVNDVLLGQARPDAEIIYAGKMVDRHTMKQDDINALLAQKAAEGKTVCRLKGGDPFLFGRGGEEALFLREAGQSFEIVPGISASISVPAYAGIPVTHRGLTSTFAAITGHEDPNKPSSDIDWSKIATGVGTLVFFMGVRNLPDIAAKLIEHGRPADTPTALIRYGTLPDQQTVTGTLATIADVAEKAKIKPPSLIVVGEVVSLRDKLAWFENRPLFGRRAVVTRARAQASDLVVTLENLGASVIEFPTIRIVPPEDPAPLQNAAAKLSDYDWIVLTSVNGVDALVGAVRQAGKDARAFAGAKLCAIGPATSARLENFGLVPDLIPPKYVAESVIETLLARETVKGKRFLLPRADIARADLREKLTEAGAVVDEVIAYRTIGENRTGGRLGAAFDGGQIDLVTFTSSSTVTHFVNRIGLDRAATLAKTAVFASIGPVTSKTLQSHRLPVHVEALEYTIPGLVEAVTTHFEKKESST